MEILPFSWKTLGTRSLRNFIAESYKPYYLPAREGKAQSRNEKHILSMSKKDKMADGSPRRFCVSHSPFKGADYCGEKLGRGRVISGRLANRFGSRFGRNTELLRGVIGPISSPSDYLDTACDDDDDDDDDDDAGAAETVPSQFPREKLQLVSLACYISLSACGKSFLTRREYALCRSPYRTESYSFG